MCRSIHSECFSGSCRGQSTLAEVLWGQRWEGGCVCFSQLFARVRGSYTDVWTLGPKSHNGCKSALALSVCACSCVAGGCDWCQGMAGDGVGLCGSRATASHAHPPNPGQQASSSNTAAWQTAVALGWPLPPPGCPHSLTSLAWQQQANKLRVPQHSLQFHGNISILPNAFFPFYFFIFAFCFPLNFWVNLQHSNTWPHVNTHLSVCKPNSLQLECIGTRCRQLHPL